MGVNKFAQPAETESGLFRVDDSIRKKQAEKIALLKKTRNNHAVKFSQQQLGESAKGSQNLMPFMLEAVEKYATLGEIADALRYVFGEY